ncbi:TPA: hypothetical protein ACT9LS_003088 [Legionella pneumophila]
MIEFLDQISKGIEANLYYLALFASLSIPDICGALGSENGKSRRDKYINWFNENVGNPKNYNLSGEDCYHLRCAMLHQGKTTHDRSGFQRVIFVEPSPRLIILHNNIINNALNIDVQIFCSDLIEAAKKWFERNS